LYDVTSISSFNNVRAWLSEIKEFANDNVIVMLIANKVDKTNERVVTKDAGQKLAQEYEVPYIETSAKTGMNVELSFSATAQCLLEKEMSTQQNGSTSSSKISSKQILTNIIQLNNETQKSSSCCSLFS